jgi:hypothetical protein
MSVFRISNSVLAVFLSSMLLQGCQTSTRTNTSRLSVGDSQSRVTQIYGGSTERDFVGGFEVWQYCSTGFASDDYVAVMLKDGRVSEIKRYKNHGNGFCSSFYKSPSVMQWETIRVAQDKESEKRLSRQRKESEKRLAREREESEKRIARQTAAVIQKSLDKAQNAKPKQKYSEQALNLNFKRSTPKLDDIAVIIGNADYQKLGADIPDVATAYADMASIRQWLIDAKGIRDGNIIQLKDATAAQMTGVFGSDKFHKGKLFNWTKPGVSNVFVYYAGHGAPAGKMGSAYLVPSDVNAETLELTGYPLSRLYKNLSKLPAKTITVILESCFSGSTQSGSVVKKSSGLFVAPKVPDVPSRMTVISAGAADQIASWEEDSSNSLFTKYFLTGLSGDADASPTGNGDGIVTYSELEEYLQDTMTYYARRYYGRTQRAQFTIH